MRIATVGSEKERIVPDAEKRRRSTTAQVLSIFFELAQGILVLNRTNRALLLVRNSVSSSKVEGVSVLRSIVCHFQIPCKNVRSSRTIPRRICDRRIQTECDDGFNSGAGIWKARRQLRFEGSSRGSNETVASHFGPGSPAYIPQNTPSAERLGKKKNNLGRLKNGFQVRIQPP